MTALHSLIAAKCTVTDNKTANINDKIPPVSSVHDLSMPKILEATESQQIAFEMNNEMQHRLF